MTLLTATEYWRSGAGLNDITPIGKLWPEGDEFPKFFGGLVGEQETVLEVGCGWGRLTRCFDSQRYIGVDICEKVIEVARSACPNYRFQVLRDGFELPPADVALFHTVLLHVPDEELTLVVARFHSPRVIVSEIMGRHWRRDGDPPVFNREAQEYVVAFAPRYRLTRMHRRPYPHYQDTDLTIMEFEC